MSMGVRLGRFLPNGPASILQSGVTPQPVLTQLLFTRYPNGVISKMSLYSPRSIGDFKGLGRMPVGGRLPILEGNV